MKRRNETTVLSASLYDQGGARIDFAVYKRGICQYRLECGGKSTSHRTLEGSLIALCEEAWCTSEFDGYDRAIELEIGDGAPLDVVDYMMYGIFDENRGDGFYRRLWRKFYRAKEEARLAMLEQLRTA